MHALLEGLTLMALASLALVVLAVVWVRHRLRRRLRIVPDVRSTAPTRFLISPIPAARLHRRLRRIGQTARLATTLDPSLAPIADDVTREALALEPRVVATAWGGRGGYVVRRDLSRQITDLESVARQLAKRCARPSTATRQAHERLAALEAAQQELADIDLRAGVLRHS